MGRRLGLILGINQYQDPIFQPLSFAENDARALAQWLVNAKGGNWATSDVQFAQGTQVTRALMESLVTQVCLHIAGPGDTVFIYFAGHAFVDETQGDGYLALTDTAYRNPATGFHLPSFAQKIIGRSQATHILFIFDCFQNGRAWGMNRSTPFDSKPLLGSPLLEELQHQPNRLFLCSCRGNEFFPEAGEQNLGLFAYRMIVGLCGPASDPTTGNIMLRPLHTYLFKNLDEQQRPQLFGQDQPPLILVGTASQPLQQLSPTDGMPPGASMLKQNNVQTGSQQATRTPIATAQKPTTGPQPHPSVEQHLRQQCKLRLEQAQHFLQLQNYSEAFNIVEQVLQVLPNDPTALIFKGQLLGKAGLYPEALAVVEQLTKIDPDNPLVWSMRAFLLTGTGLHQNALEAIEHSLELDATNPESYAIKTNIMANIAATRSKRGATSQFKKEQRGSTLLLMGLLWQFLGFVIGTTGSVLPVLLPSLPGILGILLMSLGLAWLCVNTARETYRYGCLLFVPTLLISLTSAGLLVAAYLLGYRKIIQMIIAHPTILIPVVFFALWLASAAILPLLVGLGGSISGIVRGARK